MSDRNQATETIILPVAEFRDASIHVAADCLAGYALIRANQLRTISEIVHCKISGFNVEISEGDVLTLIGLISQLSAETTTILDHYALKDPESGKDGGA
jgi:hypothetical protein